MKTHYEQLMKTVAALGRIARGEVSDVRSLAATVIDQLGPIEPVAQDEQVDLMGVKSNGETVLLGKVAMPLRMKAKDMIRELIGHGDFDDDGSDQAMWLYALEDFAKWLDARRAALPAKQEAPAPVAASVDTLEFWEVADNYRCATTSGTVLFPPTMLEMKRALVAHINAWGDAREAAGCEKGSMSQAVGYAESMKQMEAQTRRFAEENQRLKEAALARPAPAGEPVATVYHLAIDGDMSVYDIRVKPVPGLSKIELGDKLYTIPPDMLPFVRAVAENWRVPYAGACYCKYCDVRQDYSKVEHNPSCIVLRAQAVMKGRPGELAPVAKEE